MRAKGGEFIMMNINFIAVLASTVAMMVLGFLWYGPIFGKLWMREVGMTKADAEAAKKKGMTKSYVLMAVSAFVMSYVFSVVLAQFNTTDVGMALQGAFWTWLGFIATVMLGKVLWENKSWTLYALDSGYYLVGLGIIGIILTLWP